MQKADTPKTLHTEKTVTDKNAKPSKTTTAKDNLKGTKHLTGPKNVTASKTVKRAKTKPKEDKAQVHIEFFSTSGHMGSGGFGSLILATQCLIRVASFAAPQHFWSLPEAKRTWRTGLANLKR